MARILNSQDANLVLAGNGKETILATFCTKCGTALTPDKQFCTACGAPTGATAAPLPPFAGTAPTAYSQPLPPSPATGNSAVKIVLIVVGIFVGLGILGAAIFAFGVWRVSRTLHVEQHGDGVTVQTADGKITSRRGRHSRRPSWALILIPALNVAMAV